MELKVRIKRTIDDHTEDVVIENTDDERIDFIDVSRDFILIDLYYKDENTRDKRLSELLRRLNNRIGHENSEKPIPICFVWSICTLHDNPMFILALRRECFQIMTSINNEEKKED